MISLSYFSRSLLGDDESAIEDLRLKCACNNARSGITGALYYDDRGFFQFLEGESPDVMALMTKIRADGRHTSVDILGIQRLHCRRFAHWSMKVVSGLDNEDLAAVFRRDALLAGGPDGVLARLDDLLAA